MVRQIEEVVGLPAVSALGYALLCLLSRSPSTGYDLARRLRRPIGYYWTAGHTQIYPELARLAAAGLVTYRAGFGPGPREKKTYRLTATGRKTLATWLVTPPAPRAPKDELLLKTYALAAADPHRMAGLYRAAADAHAQRLAEYRSQLTGLAGCGANHPRHPGFGSYAAVRYGIAVEEQREAWCRWMEATLVAGSPDQIPSDRTGDTCGSTVEDVSGGPE
jgi:DNA-binding PadR family transcriptional regulator